MATDYQRVGFSSERELDDFMTEPSEALIQWASTLSDGLLVLGAGGKMGHTLSVMAQRAFEACGSELSVVAVSRFTDSRTREKLEQAHVETLSCDLFNEQELARLPRIRNVVYMVGRKFGSTGGEPTTWAINAFLPGLIASHLADSRFAVFSTGNVYPFTAIDSSGASEMTPPDPIGEYAQSCLARERVFQFFSNQMEIPVALLRLNYAIDMRYGVLLDLANQIANHQPIDLTMSHVNIIWQGDACDMILRALPFAASPPRILNITGTDVLKVRDLAIRLGENLGISPEFAGAPSERALLSDSQQATSLFGPPRVSIDEMLRWTADWVAADRRTLGKPTHYSEREGKF